MIHTTKICIARHGETDWNAMQMLQGWIDVPLNQKGVLQGHELAEQMATEHFSHVYTSPLQRASKTAQIIATRLKLGHPVVHEGLKERNFGIFQGRPKSELAQTHPEVLRDIVNRDPSRHFDGGETIDAFADRVIGALLEIGHHQPGKRVLVVTHGWVMDVVTRHVRHLPRTAVLNLKRKNIEHIWVKVSAGAKLLNDDGG